MNKIILIPTDFSELCLNALKQSVDLAYKLKYKIVILHVINTDTVAYFNKYLTDRLIIERLTSLKKEVKNITNVNVEYIYREGSVYDTINEVARRINAGFVIFGSYGETGIQHLTDEFAIKIMRTLKTPSIAISKKYISLKSNIMVVPINVFYEKGRCIDWVVYMSKFFKAKIHLFVENVQRKDVIKKENELLKIIKNTFEFNEVDYLIARHVKNTDFCEEILDYSVANKADMIMLLTNNRKVRLKNILDPWNSDLIFNKKGIPVICADPRKVKF